MQELFKRAHELWLAGYDVYLAYLAHERSFQLAVADREFRFDAASKARAHLEASVAFMRPDAAAAKDRAVMYAEVE